MGEVRTGRSCPHGQGSKRAVTASPDPQAVSTQAPCTQPETCTAHGRLGGDSSIPALRDPEKSPQGLTADPQVTGLGRRPV